MVVLLRIGPLQNRINTQLESLEFAVSTPNRPEPRSPRIARKITSPLESVTLDPSHTAWRAFGTAGRFAPANEWRQTAPKPIGIDHFLMLRGSSFRPTMSQRPARSGGSWRANLNRFRCSVRIYVKLSRFSFYFTSIPSWGHLVSVEQSQADKCRPKMSCINELRHDRIAR